MGRKSVSKRRVSLSMIEDSLTGAMRSGVGQENCEQEWTNYETCLQLNSTDFNRCMQQQIAFTRCLSFVRRSQSFLASREVSRKSLAASVLKLANRRGPR